MLEANTHDCFSLQLLTLKNYFFKYNLVTAFFFRFCSLKELQFEFISKGVTVNEQCAQILESVSKKNQSDKFLREWRPRQSELQQSNTKYARRYSSSVIR